MPSFNDAATADAYPAGPGPGLPVIQDILPLPNGGGRFNVGTSGGGVLVEVQYGTLGGSEWAENEEQLLNPGAYGTIPPDASGIRFRSAVPGVPGVVSASIGTDPTRPALSIDALGAISTIVTASQLVYNVVSYGAKGDGATDDTNAIQLAIAAAHTAGGGIVFFPIPAVNYLVNGTINLTDIENVRLVGAATANEPYDGPVGAILVRGSGSAPMLLWQATILSGRSLRGCGIENLGFQCNTLCPGLILKDIWGGYFKNILVYSPQDGQVGLDIGTSNIGTVGTQGCIFEQVNVTTAGTATLYRLSSATPGGTNTSGNIFIGCFGDHHGGIGVDMGDADSNTFIQLSLNRPSGTGDAILLRGSNTVGQGFARANVFYNLSANGPVRSQATALAQPALNNVVQANPESGSGGPIVEAGSTLTWTTTRADYGLDFSLSVNPSGTLRLPNNTPIVARNHLGTLDAELIKLNALDHAEVDAILQAASLEELFTTRNQNTTATLTPDLATSAYYQVIFNGAGGQTITIANPLNPPDSSHTQRLIVDVNNFSANNLTIAWGAKFISGNNHFLPLSLAAGLDTICEFVWIGGAVNAWLLLNIS